MPEPARLPAGGPAGVVGWRVARPPEGPCGRGPAGRLAPPRSAAGAAGAAGATAGAGVTGPICRPP